MATSLQTYKSQSLTLVSSWKTAFFILTRHFGKLALIAFIPNVLIYLLSILTKIMVALGVEQAGSLNAFAHFTSPYAWVTALLGLTIAIITLIGIVTLLYTIVHHERVSFISAFEESLEYIPRYLLLSIISALIGSLGVLFGAALLMIIGILLGMFSLDLLNGLFVWLSLIPFFTGTAATVLVVFAQFSMIDQNQSAWEAIKYSVKLTKTHFWRTVLYLCVFLLSVFVVGLALATIPVLGWLISLLTLTPFTIVYLYVLYASYAGIPVLDEQDQAILEEASETTQNTPATTPVSVTADTQS